MARSTKPRNEWCVVIVREDSAGKVSIHVQTKLMRTSATRHFNWLVFGECDDPAGFEKGYTVTISRFRRKAEGTDETNELFRKKGLTGKELTGAVPDPEDEPLRMQAMLKSEKKLKNLKKKGEYIYSIAVKPDSRRKSGKGNRKDRRETTARIEVCPVWPCD
jgi:hypothetical protein